MNFLILLVVILISSYSIICQDTNDTSTLKTEDKLLIVCAYTILTEEPYLIALCTFKNQRAMDEWNNNTEHQNCLFKNDDFSPSCRSRGQCACLRRMDGYVISS